MSDQVDVRAANAARARQAKQLASEDRKDALAKRAEYLHGLFQDPVHNALLKEVLEIGRKLSDYHNRVGHQGVGARETGHMLENGMAEVENFYLDKDRRLTEIDKSEGIEEFIAALERYMNPQPAVIKPKVTRTSAPTTHSD